MNLLPLVGFYYRRHAQISELLGSSGKGSLVLDLVRANTPIVKRNWPQLNKDGLLDDAVSTLESVLTDAPDQGGRTPDFTPK